MKLLKLGFLFLFNCSAYTINLNQNVKTANNHCEEVCLNKFESWRKKSSCATNYKDMIIQEKTIVDAADKKCSNLYPPGSDEYWDCARPYWGRFMDFIKNVISTYKINECSVDEIHKFQTCNYNCKSQEFIK